MHYSTDMIAYMTAFVTPVVEHWQEREIAQWGVSEREQVVVALPTHWVIKNLPSYWLIYSLFKTYSRAYIHFRFKHAVLGTSWISWLSV